VTSAGNGIGVVIIIMRVVTYLHIELMTPDEYSIRDNSLTCLVACFQESLQSHLLPYINLEYSLAIEKCRVYHSQT
jgi:hypothetical protein